MNNISLYRILFYHLPHALRQVRTLGLLKLSLSYMQMIMLRLDEQTLEARRLAWMTPQVCYIEKYLQIHFGDNTIRVIDVPDLERYAFLTEEITGMVADYIARVTADGGTVEEGSDGTYAYIALMIDSLGGNARTNDLFLTDEGTILYTSEELQGASFVVQCSLSAYTRFSQSITETVRKFKLPGLTFIFQVIA
jgi:hypothetical protein